MPPMIKVSNLGKRYTIRHNQPGRGGYRRFSEDLAGALTWPARKLRASLRSSTNRPLSAAPPKWEEFWALKDVDFEVQQGEVVGIIGRNGAGKSTLLKLLSRITEPTTGRIELNGRVASLLEVGTGFHPELTGRENIFLNGAILGMTRTEIKRKFDEIVAFAEVEKFLDTPVKRYSSGMYVRLAFAVAAHLEPEILVVDEVLAVGDAEFQKKCLGKMSEVAKGGRTVLFVSHNTAAVCALCHRAMLLQAGELKLVGDAHEIVARYAALSKQESTPTLQFPEQKLEQPRFSRISLSQDILQYGDTLQLSICITSPKSTTAAIEVEIRDHTGTPIAYCSTAPMYNTLIEISKDASKTVELRIGPLRLASGSYYLYFWLIKPWTENYHIVTEPLPFEITLSDPGGCGFDFRQSYARGATTFPLRVTEVDVVNK
jgi:lipopolysaccharide transport system ATP-binding protein